MIDREETFKRFGYWPEEVSEGSSRKIVYICDGPCKQKFQTPRYTFTGGHKCRSCSRKKIKVSKQDLIQDLKRVIAELGHQPTTAEYRRLAKHSPSIWYTRYGLTWKEVLNEIGLKRKRKGNQAFELNEIYEDVRRVAREIGRPPSALEYRIAGKIDYNVVRKRFGFSWESVIQKIFGLSDLASETYGPGKHSTKPLQYYLDKIKSIASKLGRAPTYSEASMSPKILKRFNSTYQELLAMAGIDKRSLPNEFIYTSNEEIIRDINKVFRICQRTPSGEDYRRHGRFAVSSVRLRLGGSWQKVLEAAGLLKPEPATIEQQPAPVVELSPVEDPTRDFIKDASLEAIQNFFKEKEKKKP